MSIKLLKVKTPESYLDERRYILDLIFKHWLGIEYEHEVGTQKFTLISMNGDQNSMGLCLPDIFFQTPIGDWLTERSMPLLPLNYMNFSENSTEITLIDVEVPIILGSDDPTEQMGQFAWKKLRPFLWTSEKKRYLGIDILGAAFFVLTRYEEYVKADRDNHSRFPGCASLAFQEGFLDRPIINEYVEILWWCLQGLWPEINRKSRNFRMLVSHDVDIPLYQAFIGLYSLMRNCAGDILKRRTPPLALQRIKSWCGVKKGDYKKDLNYSFDRLMDISERNNLRSAFYFKTGCTNKYYDYDYSIDHPYIRQLIRDIYSRGHEIGFHPSYDTFLSLTNTRLEFEKLLRVCEEEGIKNIEWGGRQHFLRWQVPVTWRNWAETGLAYDSSLSYADKAGFRCGTCYEYPVYDLEQRKTLSLYERPLIAMEVSILEEEYMGLSGQEAMDYLNKLKHRCEKFNGDFTLLWHNSSFLNNMHWEIYESLLDEG